jgi:predicted naringenin-chalcone synthase
MASIDTHRRHTALSYGQHHARPTRRVPTLAALAVLDPRGATSQDEAMELLGLAGDEFAERVFPRAGVERRELNLDEAFLAGSVEQRTAAVEEQLLDQAVRALEALDVELDKVGTVLTSSLYSLGCPSLAHRLIERCGMDPATDKYHVTAVGCASAVPLFRLGGQILRAEPSRDVLVIAAENMSSLQSPALADSPRAKTVGAAIFGDGCAAALLAQRSGTTGPEILATAVYQVSGTLEAVEVTNNEHGTYLGLTPELPRIAGAGLPGLVADFLTANGVDETQIAHWMLHPGGRRIVEEERDALGLDDADVAVSWKALADHGNVGTPSIFYVLDATVRERRPAPGELGLAVTIGPGVTVGLMLVGF